MGRRWRVAVSCLLALGCTGRVRPGLIGPSSAPVFIPPALAFEGVPRSDAEWRGVGREAAALLSQYVQINTTNPPGNELVAARWLAALLGRDPWPAIPRAVTSSQKGDFSVVPTP